MISALNWTDDARFLDRFSRDQEFIQWFRGIFLLLWLNQVSVDRNKSKFHFIVQALMNEPKSDEWN